MIVAKTPLRISFFGGSSDIPSFYNENEGLCISTTIDKYMYITLCKTSLKGVKAVYNEIETASDIEQIKHDRIRNTLKYFNINSGVEIASFSQIPTKGTGLGSSSAFTVGLIDCVLNFINDRKYNRYDVAELASKIEIELCNEPIGKQDQYAAAFGGFNYLRFNKDGTEVTPVPINGSIVSELNNNLLMFYTGIRRDAAAILKDQNKQDNTENVRKIVDIAKESSKYLKQHRVDDFGALLDTTWKIKRLLSNSISSNYIDDVYDEIIKAGALGGKILGAGGGGYILFYVNDRYKDKVRETAVKFGLEEFLFNFSNEGSRVEYSHSY